LTSSDAQSSAIRVSLYAGNVVVAGRQIDLTGRDFVVLANLARAASPVSPETLEAAIWPSRGSAARNNLQVHIYRLRSALGDRDAIRLTRAGYRLHEDVVVDLHEVRRALAESFQDATLSTELRDRLASMFARMSVGRPARLRRQPGFVEIEALLHSWTVAVAKRLAVDAFQLGRYDRALLYANVAAEDATDLEASDVIVRSLTALGRLDEPVSEARDSLAPPLLVRSP
jgi:DNA-binding winged helix-turn-helix (wHTH) protein